jgi:hypothetical protein
LKESSYFVTVATHRHRAPAPATGSGIVIEEEPARWVGTAADGSLGTLDQQFGGGTGQRGEEPVQAALSGDKLKGPGALMKNELIVTLGDAQHFIDRLDPGCGIGFFVYDASENGPKGFAKPEDSQEGGIHGLGFCKKKGSKTATAVFGNKSRIHKKRNKFVPGKIVGGGGEIGEIKCHAAGDQWRRLSSRMHPITR